eukprot:m.59150 g.59150  ORF g.59150 m.59150 type:complete len:371 (+) comp9446_c0_seq2:381-1493(+)
MDDGPPSKPGPAVISVDWNEDKSCFALSTEVGFSVWQSDPIAAMCHRDIGGMSRVGLFHRTSLLVLVGGGNEPFDSPNKAVFWDDVQCRVVGYVEFRLPILDVQRRKDLMFVATKAKVYTYRMAIVKSELKEPPMLLHEADAGDNPRGLFCAHYTPMTDVVKLVHPTAGRGHVCVTNFSAALSDGAPPRTSKPPAMIEAHRHALRFLALAPSGTLLATASTSGTVIKVFDLESGGLQHVLRAQVLSAEIGSLCFNRAETLVCGTFETTLHVFQLAKPAADKKDQSYAEWVSAYVPLPKFEGGPSAAKTRLPGASSCVFLPDAASALAVCTNGSALRFRLMLSDAKLQMSEFHKLHRRDEQSDFLKMLDYA